MKKLLFISLFSFFSVEIQAQSLYFPPKVGDNWETVSPASLGWCVDKIDSLYNFLEQENTKGFIVLKDGKIVLENYFGTFTADSSWYWASAGKTITSLLVGQAQEDGLLSVNDTSSKYLGEGWTNCTANNESSIAIRNQLTMTSGLDDEVIDNHCTIDTCLNCIAEAGTRWAYHNAPYTLLEKVLENASGQSINSLTQLKLKSPTGMTGFWFTVDYDNVYFSKARCMARFGLLIQNNGIWEADTLIKDTTYLHQMVNTSQTFNKSYGYLWWLNGKDSYMIPGFQMVIPGSYAPQAPLDMIAGLGKNGQIVSISKQKGLVVVRMGNQPSSPSVEIATIFCNQIWEKLNRVICDASVVEEPKSIIIKLEIIPNPAKNQLCVKVPSNGDFSIEISDVRGKVVMKIENESTIDISALCYGFYFIVLKQNETIFVGKLIKQ